MLTAFRYLWRAKSESHRATVPAKLSALFLMYWPQVSESLEQAQTARSVVSNTRYRRPELFVEVSQNIYRGFMPDSHSTLVRNPSKFELEPIQIVIRVRCF